MRSFWAIITCSFSLRFPSFPHFQNWPLFYLEASFCMGIALLQYYTILWLTPGYSVSHEPFWLIHRGDEARNRVCISAVRYCLNFGPIIVLRKETFLMCMTKVRQSTHIYSSSLRFVLWKTDERGNAKRKKKLYGFLEVSFVLKLEVLASILSWVVLSLQLVALCFWVGFIRCFLRFRVIYLPSEY